MESLASVVCKPNATICVFCFVLLLLDLQPCQLSRAARLHSTSVHENRLVFAIIFLLFYVLLSHVLLSQRIPYEVCLFFLHPCSLRVIISFCNLHPPLVHDTRPPQLSHTAIIVRGIYHCTCYCVCLFHHLMQTSMYVC